MTKKLFNDFTLPSVEPSKDFMSELSAISKNHEPLAPVKAPSKKKRIIRDIGLGLATGTLVFSFYTNIDHGQGDSTQISSAGTSLCQDPSCNTKHSGSKSFSTDAGYSNRYEVGNNSAAPESSSSSDNAGDSCVFSVAHFFTWVQCILASDSE